MNGIQTYENGELESRGMSCGKLRQGRGKGLGACGRSEQRRSIRLENRRYRHAGFRCHERSLIDAVKRAAIARILLFASRRRRNPCRRRELIRSVLQAHSSHRLVLGAMHLVPSRFRPRLVIIALFLPLPDCCAPSGVARKRLDADVLSPLLSLPRRSVGEFIAAGEVAFIMLLGAQLEEYTIRRARRSLAVCCRCSTDCPRTAR